MSDLDEYMGEEEDNFPQTPTEDLFAHLLGSSTEATPIRSLGRSTAGILNSSLGFTLPPDTFHQQPMFPQTPNTYNFPTPLLQTPVGIPSTPSFSYSNTVNTSTSSNNHTTPSLPPQPIPQPPQAHQSAQQILATIYTLLHEQDEKLKRIATEQAQLLQQPQLDVYNGIAAQLRALREQMETELRALQHLNQQVILDPPDLARLMILLQDLRIQMKQLELYHNELQQLLQPQPTIQPIAALVICKQPFPVVITKGKQLGEEQLTVRLLTGASSQAVPAAAVKATLLSDTHSAPSRPNAPSSPIESDVQHINPARVAHFPLKFLSGTRKSAVHIKMGVPVRAGPGGASITVESEMSNPFVVITNECQWENSAGTLLKKDAFGGQLEITWPQFVNTLQRHFLIATRQDMVRPKRPLSLYDFQYINSQFFGNRTVIHQKDFDNFWSWFGRSMQTLRYQRHICALWQTGVIYGFITRDDVNSALNNQEPGTFIVRFSERNPGQFGIAYCSTEHPIRIKHYLVQQTDCFAARKTFPDFLSEIAQFVYVLQLSVDPNGRTTFVRLHKDVALEPYTVKKATQVSLGGYEPLK